jgi:hypothetical protein
MRTKKGLWISTIFLLGIIFFVSEGLNAAVVEKKTLKRKPDPVIMDGKLAREVIGSSLTNLRLYAYRDGKFEPILFQIDEMTGENGDWIMNGGPIKSLDLSNGKFDTWDKLLFMAEDIGDKVSKDDWTAGYTKGSEIEVIDPITGEKGWCYFLYFASNPPAKSTEPPYVSYDYETEIFKSDMWEAHYIITPDGFHTTYYKKHLVTKKAGGNGISYADRLKIRPRFKVFGMPINLNEEGVKCNVIGHQIGPIRLIRRLEQYVPIAGIPALRVVEDVMYYRYTATVPVQFEIPIGHPRKMGVQIVIRFGTDYTSDVLGSRCYSSTSREEGYLINGKMDDDEANYPSQMDNWRLITGDFGTFMTRTMLTREIKDNVKISMGLIDDENYKYPPEAFPGSIGYVWQDWDFSDGAKGIYHLYVEFYTIPYYKKGDEVAYLNYLDHPLKIQVGSQESTSQMLLRPEYEKRYKKHYTAKDIQNHLKKNPM